MGLPSINTLPEYTITLPCTKKELKFRPFTAKEQINLLTAKESEDVESIMTSIKSVLGGCVTNNIDIEELPLPDFEYFMVKIRAQSVSETSETRFKCNNKISEDKECGTLIDVNVNLDDIRLSSELPDPIIKLTENSAVEVVPPAFKIATLFTDENSINEKLISIIADSITTIYVGEEVYYTKSYTHEERVKFTENLTTEQFSKIADYIKEYPSLVLDVNFTCPKCGFEHTYNIASITDFFG